MTGKWRLVQLGSKRGCNQTIDAPAVRLVWAFFAILALLVCPVGVQASGRNLPEGNFPAIIIPDGFQLILAEPGVALYRKDYPNGSPDFVQIIDLGQGAALDLQHGQITDVRPGKGVYGGNDPRFGQLPLTQFWRQAKNQSQYAFCVTNGQFFYMPESPTRLAFPLKVDGEVISDGWAIQQYPEQKLMLELWEDHADITPLTKETLYGSQAPNIIAGLTEEANKKAKYAVGRTFFGVDDLDGDGRFETVLVINTQTARQVEVADVLRQWGADKVMMLDGGGSTQLLCKGTSYIISERLIPQAIAVYSASPPPVAFEIIQLQPLWLVQAEGEQVQFNLTLKNQGTEAWQPGDHSLVIEAGNLTAQQALEMSGQVQPGETLTLTVRLMAYWRSGIYPAELAMHFTRGEKSFASQSLNLHTVVLSQSLSSQKAELAAQIDQWVAQPEADLNALVQGWLKEQGSALQPQAPGAIRPGDILIIPALMLPVLAFILIGILRGRQ
ncbi:MAG: phosphodiester glycosidase family protein [Anaerolineales bacterium]|nr:phosphodiester glycosidase family protein [Anaerolineales bacterium]